MKSTTRRLLNQSRMHKKDSKELRKQRASSHKTVRNRIGSKRHRESMTNY